MRSPPADLLGQPESAADGNTATALVHDAEIQFQHPATRIRFLGPWPPYSFADAGPGGGPGR